MKTTLLFATAFLLLSLSSPAQEVTTAPPGIPADSLKEFRYLYKGEMMPFDSGVAMSERQYSFLLKQSIYVKLEEQTTSAINKVPEVVFVNKEVRRKGDGNKGAWGLGGALLGLVIGFFATK